MQPLKDEFQQSGSCHSFRPLHFQPKDFSSEGPSRPSLQPSILVLDEPTNYLDIHHQLQLLRFVKSLKTTVVAALHDLNLTAMFCDKLCLLDHGGLVALGSPEKVLTKEILSETYRIKTDINPPLTGSLWVFPS